MDKSFILLGDPESTLLQALATDFHRADLPCNLLSLNAPFEGKPVTVAPGKILWEDCDLGHANAIFMAEPLFPWPQVELPEGELPVDFSLKSWGHFQREARSLTVSAVLAAAEVCPVINPPLASHFAVAPATALDQLAQMGFPIHPWSLVTRPTSGQALDWIIRDVAGRDRWHEPGLPESGESCIRFEGSIGGVASFLVLGTTLLGGIQYPDVKSWAASNDDLSKELTDTNWDAAVVDTALRAVAALHLDYAAITLHTNTSPPAIVFCQAGPKLETWNKALAGALVPALKDHLRRSALNKKGVSS